MSDHSDGLLRARPDHGRAVVDISVVSCREPIEHCSPTAVSSHERRGGVATARAGFLSVRQRATRRSQNAETADERHCAHESAVDL